MQLFITILHVVLCVILILIILLQPGKEGAAAFGGSGGNQMYGPRGQAHLLGRATTVVAAMFMLTSITLAWLSGSRVSSDTDLEKGIESLPGLQETEGFKIDLPTPAPAAGEPGASLRPSTEPGKEENPEAPPQGTGADLPAEVEPGPGRLDAEPRPQ